MQFHSSPYYYGSSAKDPLTRKAHYHRFLPLWEPALQAKIPAQSMRFSSPAEDSC